MTRCAQTRPDWRLQGMLMATIAVLLVIGITTSLPAQPPADEVVARVNGQVITERDVYEAMFRQSGRQVVEHLIIQALIKQAVAEANVEVPDDTVQAELDRLRAQTPPGMTWEEMLAASGIGEDELAEEIRLNLAVQQLLSSRIEIEEEEIRDFFDQYKDFLGTDEQVRVRHILVETEEEANEIREQLLKGADFAALARERSIDPGSAERGGDLGWVARNRMVRAFEEVAFSSPVGEISPVFQTEFGFHVLQVQERQEAREADYEQSREEIIGYLMEDKMQAEFEEWLKEIEERADIERYF